MIGLVLGGLVLLALLVVGGAALVVNSGGSSDVTLDRTTTTLDGTSTSGTEARGSTAVDPTSTVAGTGEASVVTGADVSKFLRDEQAKVTPDLAIGSIDCPPSPYRVGHVIVCTMHLEDADVLYRIEITGRTTLTGKPTRPIIDTNKAEALMEQKEPGETGSCGEPRIRQVDVGDQLTCHTGAHTWDFTIGPDGDISGHTR